MITQVHNSLQKLQAIDLFVVELLGELFVQKQSATRSVGRGVAESRVQAVKGGVQLKKR